MRKIILAAAIAGAALSLAACSEKTEDAASETADSAAADAAAKLKGVRKVLLAEAEPLAERLAEPVAALVVSLADKYDAIVAPATTMGKNVMPRVAALLDVMQVSEIIEVVSADTFKRPIYAGNAIQTVQSTDPKKVVTVRTASFQAAHEGGSASVETIQAAEDPDLSTFVENRSRMDRTVRGYRQALRVDPVGTSEKLDRIIRNTYRTLMTRGMKGCYVYATDPETRDYFRKRLASSD